MYISFKWLEKYLPNLNQFTNEDIAQGLTNALAEVEEFFEVRGELVNIYAGEVTKVEQHPKSDKLSVCEVNLGNKTNTIICGAPNVKEGIKVAVCLPGGKVFNPKEPGEVLEIAEREVAGVLSKGMICSPKELGISDEHTGIMVLEDDINIGTDIRELLIDIIFEIENKSISHRSDCFSHIGIAKELAAILETDFVQPHLDEGPLGSNPELELNLDIKVSEEFCRRFTAIIIKDLVVKPSPLWIQARLSAVGVRPINNIVDVTNFIMLDKGQPLHAYDYDKLEDHTLIVRKAKEKEKVKTLDDQEHTLTNEMVVVADKNGVEDIAGIMGGHGSQITNDTTTIVLEAANWNMFNIRKTSRTLHIRTEASTRFEKGLDPNFTEIGLVSATKLLIDLTDAEIASDVIDVYPTPREEKQVKLDTNLVQRFLGIDLTKQETIALLERLHIEKYEPENSSETDTNKV
ncbi:phenylalanine--tRNA ligase subunit beta, partial [Candidatus Dojkabacteria bacterium]|nr:phenylalanine--tRNA ligase subunit beta [Candidatus Dojkabacteria bacterium]